MSQLFRNRTTQLYNSARDSSAQTADSAIGVQKKWGKPKCAVLESSHKEDVMPTLLIVVLLLLLLGGGGGYWGYSRWGAGGGIGIFGVVLIVLLVVYVLGGRIR